MSFLSRYDAAPAADRDSLVKAAMHADGPALFAELLRDRPILVGTDISVVTRHADCVAVLSRPQAFTVALYGSKMADLGLPVMLGQDDTADYDRDHAAMRLVMNREDLDALRQAARAHAKAAFGEAQGEIDVAAPTRLLVCKVLGGYLGLGTVDPRQLSTWAREIFRGIFLHFDRDVSKVLRAATDAFAHHVTLRIAERRRAGDAANTVLDRLLTLRVGADPLLDDAAIRTNLIGLMTGGLEPISDAVASVIDALLDYPDALAQARAAVAADDMKRLLAVCTEALRLRPPLSLLVRQCSRATTIAEGTPHVATIPEGHIVFAAISAAGLDPAVAINPLTFDAGRPFGLCLVFGAGPHACFGRRIAEVIMTEQVRALLRLRSLERAQPPRERIVLDAQDGAFVDSFHVAV